MKTIEGDLMNIHWPQSAYGTLLVLVNTHGKWDLPVTSLNVFLNLINETAWIEHYSVISSVDLMLAVLKY